MSADVVPTAACTKLGPGSRQQRGPALLVLVSGELRVSPSDSCEVVALAERDVVVVRSGESVELGSGANSAEVILLEMDAAWTQRARDLAGAVATQLAVPFFVERGGTRVARRVEKLLCDLCPTRAAETPAGRLRAASDALELLALVFEDRRELLEPGARRGAGRRVAFREAVARLESESLDEVSLESFAREIRLSPRQVSRLFREELGTTFREHLVALRLARAKDLLECTHQSILEVAGETGWSSLAHFNTVFRRHFGATPSRYRERFGNPVAG